VILSHSKSYFCAKSLEPQLEDSRTVLNPTIANMSSSKPSLPAPSSNQTYVTISPINGGRLTLPDSAFISPADPAAKRHVPSLSFLITPSEPISHQKGFINTSSKKKPLRILFDLGLRHNISKYSELQQRHLKTRSPFETQPGVAAILEKGGIGSEDIDVVILSHVHYDHHGDPEDFPNAQFLVGSGSLDVLAHGLSPELGSHQHFDPNLLPVERTKEFPPLNAGNDWKPLGPFPRTLDLLGNGSIYVIDTPGHLPGHINLLCRTKEEKWVCLCGDAYHDPRLLSGEKDIGTWEGEGGRICCIHLDRKRAEESIGRLRELQGMGVEMIAAHDDDWLENNRDRFFPESL
jgi:glyoxylase-like metal-dependent hydrolase (beta-lactamase superfamily II)